MTLRKRSKESIPELKNPGDNEPERGSPGSIEQQLDMCEEGSLRGDDILYTHGRSQQRYSGNPRDLDKLIDDNWHMDLSEDDREGAEMSGDEHSSGLEGGEPELEGQSHIATLLPGDRTKHEELEERTEEHTKEQDNLPGIE